MPQGIRKNILMFLSYVSNFTQDIPVRLVRNYIEMINSQKNTIKSININKNVKFNILNSTYSTKTQLYTDFYQYYMLQFRLSNCEECNRLINLFGDKDITNIDNLYNNDLIFAYMLDSLLYLYNSNIFERVLLSKALTNDDKAYLSNINPYFKKDDEAFNIDINLNTMGNILLNERKYVETHEELKMLYDECSNFLINLYKLNKKECIDYIISLISEGTGIISCNYENEKTIKIDKFNFNQENLALMLSEYYEYNFKSLRYKNGEDYEL